MGTQTPKHGSVQIEHFKIDPGPGSRSHSPETVALGLDSPNQDKRWIVRARFWLSVIMCFALVSGAFFAGYSAHEHRVFPLRPFAKRTLQEIGILDQARLLKKTHKLPEINSVFGAIDVGSAYYDFKGEIYDLPVPEDHAYGGIAAFREGLVFVDAIGHVWFFENGGFTKVESGEIPNDRDAYLKRISGIDVRWPAAFAVKDIEVIEAPRTYIYASASDYDPAGDCLSLSVFRSEISGSRDGAMTAGPWSRVFSTQPCLEIDMTNWKPKSAGQFPELAQSGGRIVRYSESEILLSVGDLQADGVQGPQMVQDMGNHYGKIIRLDLATFTPKIFSIGHRNTQGLVRTRDGRVFSTEHGPEGGDELNHVVAGRNYGWPFVTFGTDYGAESWPLDQGAKDHSGYEKPTISWVPSIATSNLVEVTSEDLPFWDGDLLISTLAASSLYRVELNGLAAIVVEPIYVGSRIRDIVNFDGGFALQTDQENQLILLRSPALERRPVSLSEPPMAGEFPRDIVRPEAREPAVTTADTEGPRR